MTAKETQQLTEARKDIEYMQKDLTEIKQTLDSLPKRLVDQLDERYAKKHEVEEIKETVAPLTTLRRRLWTIYLLAVFSVGGILAIGIEYLRNLNK